MSRARSLSRLANEQALSVSTDFNVGVNSTSPVEKLNVVGVVSATSFSGDGSGLTGVASTDNIITGTAATFTGSVNVSGAANFSGITTVGILTAYTDVTFIGAAANITFDKSANAFSFADDAEAKFGDSGDLKIYHDGANSYVSDVGTGDLRLSGSFVKLNNAGNTATMVKATDGGSVEINHNGSKKFETTGSGAIVTGIATATGIVAATGTFSGNVSVGGTLTYEDVTNVDSVGVVTARAGVRVNAGGINVTAGGVNVVGGGLTVTGVSTFFTGFHTKDILAEEVKVTAGKLSDNTNIDLENGMVHLFTTAESTTSTPNIRYNGSTALNAKMSIGQSIVVTLITTANASAYSANMTIDGGAQTERWIGGSAPSGGGSSGVDIHTFTIIKTADATFTVIGNHSKTS